MSPSHFVRLLLGAPLAVAIACSDGSGPGKSTVTPKAILKISGDSQAAVRGTGLPLPLRVRVLGSDDRPMAGATVYWVMFADAGTLTHNQSVTSASGETETRVTALATTGDGIPVRAAVPGVDTAIFSITGLDPCYFDFAPWLTVSSTTAGTLTSLSCNVPGGWVANLYNFSLAGQRAVRLEIQAAGYEPVAQLWPYQATWHWIQPPPAEGSHRVALKAILVRGNYGVVSMSHDASGRGPYRLDLQQTLEDATSCEDVLVLRGTTTTQHLAADDCPGPSGRFDKFRMVAIEGERLHVSETSTAFVPHLQLVHRGEIVAESDGAPSGTATIDFIVTTFGDYDIHAMGSAPQEGAYTLTISGPPPATNGIATNAARAMSLHDPRTLGRNRAAHPLHGAIP